MKITFRIEEDFQASLYREYKAGERVVTRAMDRAGDRVKRRWRRQIRDAGLGSRLANTIRAKRYPKGTDSMNAAALIWSKAPEIIDAHEKGSLIRAKNGVWLAIPLPAAGKKGLGGKRITPIGWEQRTGMRLRFVYRKGRPPLLVADDARLSGKRQLAAPNRRRRRKDGILTGAVTVPIFVLVPQVKLPKRLDLMGEAERVARTIPGAIVRNWR